MKTCTITLLAALIAVSLPGPSGAQGLGMGGVPQLQQPQVQPQPQQQWQQAPQMPAPNAAPPNQPNYGNGGNPGGAPSDQLSQWERRDMGVAPTPTLHSGEPHGPTPNQIPGGQLITTKGLLPLMQQQDMPVYVFDALGGSSTLPNAINVPWAAKSGSFDDETQQRVAQMLRQVTRGQVDAPLVFYCASPECWLSYNAALRAIRAGYRNVLWYRGGLQAWQGSGLPLNSSSAMPQGSFPGSRQGQAPYAQQGGQGG